MLLGEISGMAYQGDDIYALNDGGNGPYIFQLDMNTGRTKKRFRINNIRNKDWEELSIYNGYLYIADLGNNRGNRRDLAIHRIRIDSLEYSDTPVMTTAISYSLQQSFKHSTHNHEWDCEAMVVCDDGIFCFSKNWKNLITVMYEITGGEMNNLSPADSFDAGFLVTGAYYDSECKGLYLCGYYDNETYLLHFRNAETSRFTADYKKYIIPELKNAQVESVFVHGDFIYLASERTLKSQAIYRIPLSNLE
ncbi:MAG: hypothetical protein U5K32_05640 [Bacteroidales bacterium]|nr:hypothetical protein [Bacteroidales bacterium]